MKKKLFDRKIYLEGLRQTKVLGLFLLIATVVGSALVPLSEFASYITFPTEYSSPVNLIAFTPFLIVFIFLAPILLSMNLFSFLNKRNGSDFYHALPCTRTCLLTNFSLSIVTWLAGTILMTTLVNGFLYTICPVTYINWAFIPYSFFTYFCGSLLVLAVMLIAKSITGTGISNIVVAVLIGFGPRALAMIFVSVLTDILPILDAGNMGFFMNTAYNIPVNFVFGLGMIDDTSISFIPGMIATFVLALVYFGIAWLLFRYRKSETAQKSAPNKVMQHVIRCLITIPITLIIPIGVVENDDVTPYPVIVIFFLAAIIYFGYELLSTKKVKNLLTALPVFAVVILFDVLFGVALVGTKHAMLIVPEASDVNAVSVAIQGDGYDSNQYNLLLTENYFIEDENLIQMVTDSLKSTVQDIKDDNYYHKLYSDDGLSYYSYPVSIRKKNGSVMKRNILLSSETLNEIFAVYEQDDGYQERLVQLPEKESIEQIKFYDEVPQAETEEIWKIFCEEYATLSYEEKLLTNGIGDFYENSGWDDMSLTKIPFTVYGYQGIQSYRVEYSISAKTPKTYQTYMEMINKQSQKQIELFFDELELLKQGKEENIEYQLSLEDCNYLSYYMNGSLTTSGFYSSTAMYGLYTHDTMLEAYSILEDATTRPVDLKQQVFKMDICRYNWNAEDGGRYGENIVYYFSLTDAETEVLSRFFEYEVW